MHVTQLLGCLKCFVTSLTSQVKAVVRLTSVVIVLVNSVLEEAATTVERRVLQDEISAQTKMVAWDFFELILDV